MSLTLYKPSTGAVDIAAQLNQNWSDLETYANARSLPKGYVGGLTVRYASTSTVVVSSGTCRDAANSFDLSLSQDTALDISTINAAAGLERRTLSGSVSLGSMGSIGPGIAGTGTAFLTEFAPNGTPRALSGTFSAATSGFPPFQTSTFTGSGTKFLTELSVNDMIGNASGGYFRVTAIASDASLVARPGASFGAGTSGGVIENPTFEANGIVSRLDRISSNTSAASSALYTYSPGPHTAYTGSKVSSGWYAVWVLQGASGTTVALSTQRTRPFASISGYDARWRRIGWARVGTAGDLSESHMTGRARRVLYSGLGSGEVRVLSAGTATAFTAVALNTVVPPTTRLALLNLVTYRGTNANGQQVYAAVRPRGSSVSTGGAVQLTWATTDSTSGAGTASSPLEVFCDAAQVIEYARVDAGNAQPTIYIDVLGYEDDLSL